MRDFSTLFPHKSVLFHTIRTEMWKKLWKRLFGFCLKSFAVWLYYTGERIQRDQDRDPRAAESSRVRGVQQREGVSVFLYREVC